MTVNSVTCDRCESETDQENQFDFCWHCGTDLCAKCMTDGCCNRVPAIGGTGRANVLYRYFGSNPPAGVTFDEETNWS